MATDGASASASSSQVQAGSTPARAGSASPSAPAPRAKTRPSRCYSIEALYGSPDARAPHSPASRAPLTPASPATQSSSYPGMPGLSTIMSSEPGQLEDNISDTEAPPGSALLSPSSAANPPPAKAATHGRRRAHSVTVKMPSSNKQQYQRMKDRDVEAEAGGATTSRLRASSDARQSVSVRMSSDSHPGHVHKHGKDGDDDSLDDDMVGLLDCVDTEVGTVNHLQNMTNGIVFPHIPGLSYRKAHVTLPAAHDESDTDLTQPHLDEDDDVEAQAAKKKRPRAGTLSRILGKGTKEAIKPEQPTKPEQEAHLMNDMVQDKLDAELESEADDAHKEHDLDRHLRKVLTSTLRKDKIKAGLRGLWAYIKTPMGMVVAIYGVAVVFWGAAIIFFLAGWIPTSSKDTQDKWVEISSQVVNGLFTITGVGLIPWRVIDTYRISIIWMSRKKIEKRRKKQGLPPIENYDDLPDPETIPGYVNVLTTEEQKKLRHNQEKFSESQTWYKPHATATHTAFPMAFALWNTILMDGNSFFQCILCGTMWGLNRHQRPAWSTGILIPLSFLCGIGAAILIWQGGVRTKKTKVVEEKLRKALGVDEKGVNTDDAKRPRRATVSGAPPPRLEIPNRPRRSASIDVVSDPAVVERFNREHDGLSKDLLRHDKLDIVAESGDEEDASADEKDDKDARQSPSNIVPTLPQQ